MAVIYFKAKMMGWCQAKIFDKVSDSSYWWYLLDL